MLTNPTGAPVREDTAAARPVRESFRRDGERAGHGAAREPGMERARDGPRALTPIASHETKLSRGFFRRRRWLPGTAGSLGRESDEPEMRVLAMLRALLDGLEAIRASS